MNLFLLPLQVRSNLFHSIHPYLILLRILTTKIKNKIISHINKQKNRHDNFRFR